MHIVDLAEVQVGTELGSGGQATVHECHVAGRENEQLLFKKYRGSVAAAIDVEALTALVAWPASLSKRERAIVARASSWPDSIVSDPSGQVVGVLLPRAPQHFFYDAAAQSSTNGSTTPKLRELGNLILESRSRKIGMTSLSTEATLGMLQELASLLAVFHRRGVVHGDISMRNVLWSPEDGGSCYLLDCDGAALHGRSAGEQPAMTLGWTDPRVIDNEIDRPDQDSDLYALAAAVYRAHYRVRGAEPGDIDYDDLPDDPPISAKAVQLFQHAFVNGSNRPTASRWKKELDALLTGDYGLRVPPFRPADGNGHPPDDARVVDATGADDELEVTLLGGDRGAESPLGPPPSSRRPGPPQPESVRRWLPAAVMVAIVGILAAFAIVQSGDDGGGVVTGSGSGASDPAATIEAGNGEEAAGTTTTAAGTAEAAPTDEPEPVEVATARPTATARPQPTATPVPEPITSSVALVNTALNLRVAPSTGAQLVREVEVGEVLTFIGEPQLEADRFWQRVEVGADGGWVAARYLVEAPGCERFAQHPSDSEVTLRTTPSSSGSIVDTVRNGQLLVVTDRSGNWLTTTEPRGGWVFDEHVGFRCAGVPEVRSNRTATLVGTGVRLREGPSTDATIIDTLRLLGTSVVITEGPTENGWVRIEVATNSGVLDGWMFGAFVSPPGDGWHAVQHRGGLSEPIPLYLSDGRRVAERWWPLGSALVSDVSGQLWQVQLPTGETAFLDPDDVREP